MNIINIALNELKRKFRDKRTVIFMIAFPIALMFILGSALSGVFNENISVGNIRVLYQNNGNETFTAQFEAFAKEAEESNITFQKITDGADGRELAQQENYDGYVEIDDTHMTLYVTEQNSVEGSIIEGLLAAFADKYNIASAIAQVAPTKADTAFAAAGNAYIKETSLQGQENPGAMDYYAVSITTMIILFSAMPATYLLRDERTMHTAERLMAAPVRKFEIFLGKILGSLVLNFICVLLIIFFSKFVFSANWGEHLWFVLLILLTQVFFVVSFALGVSSLFPSNEAPRMIAMVFAQVAAIIGGAYSPVNNEGGIGGFLTSLSPLKWMNTAIFNIIYNNDLSASIPAVSLNIGIAIIFLLITIISSQRREGL